MDHSQRLHKCLSSEPVDRPPVALWRHFPVEDQDPALLAKSVVSFQETYDFDLVKITPASSYCLKDWRLRDEWHGNPEGTREIIDFPIKKPEDWKNIHPLMIKNNALSTQLDCIGLIKAHLPSNTPIIQTIFNPLSQAKNLVGKNNLVTHIRLYPDLLKIALRNITDTTLNFLKAMAPLDIDGIFYAVQHAQANLLSKSEFHEFSLPYDLEILDYCKEYWLNLLHVHGENIYFDKIKGYPCQVFNWHDQQTAPDLATAKSMVSGAVCGGLRQWDTLVNGTPKDVVEEANKAIKATHGERFILGTGCVLPITAPHSNILAARKAVEKVES
jgi:uroporphyrinogen decarboxylase